MKSNTIGVAAHPCEIPSLSVSRTDETEHELDKREVTIVLRTHRMWARPNAEPLPICSQLSIVCNFWELIQGRGQRGDSLIHGSVNLRRRVDRLPGGQV